MMGGHRKRSVCGEKKKSVEDALLSEGRNPEALEKGQGGGMTTAIHPLRGERGGGEKKNV